jgi:hypothetical protein
MRIIDSIPHESMTISIFQMNDKYLVKYEAGPMEQTFKFLISDFRSLAGLKEKLGAGFTEATRKRFNEMFLQMKEALSGEPGK